MLLLMIYRGSSVSKFKIDYCCQQFRVGVQIAFLVYKKTHISNSKQKMGLQYVLTFFVYFISFFSCYAYSSCTNCRSHDAGH